ARPVAAGVDGRRARERESLTGAIRHVTDGDAHVDQVRRQRGRHHAAAEVEAAAEESREAGRVGGAAVAVGHRHRRGELELGRRGAAGARLLARHAGHAATVAAGLADATAAGRAVALLVADRVARVVAAETGRA